MIRIDYQSRDDFSAEKKQAGMLAPFRPSDLSAGQRQARKAAMYRPSMDEVWRELAKRLQGQFIPGCWGMSTRVMADIGHWTITLDTYGGSNSESWTTYTRVRAPYLSRDGFRFRIHQAKWFTPIADRLGFGRVRTGDRAFDARFVIKANDDRKASELFADDGVRKRIGAHRRIFLQAIDEDGYFPDDVDELHLTVPGVIADMASLESMFQLLPAVLHRLCEIGSAVDANPDLSV